MLQPNCTLAVDLVVLTVIADRLHVLTVRRGVPPFRGRLALPGGFLLDGEDLLDAAERELAEETGVRGLRVHLEQLGTYGAPTRDPRGRVVSVAYLALVPAPGTAPVGGTDAASAEWTDAVTLAGSRPGPAFDHRRILLDGIERARAKLEYTPLAAAFCPPTFTVHELRQVYEAVWGVALDPRNFHRKVTGTQGFVEATGTTAVRGSGRPAQLYRRGDAVLLHPAMLRPDTRRN